MDSLNRDYADAEKERRDAPAADALASRCVGARRLIFQGSEFPAHSLPHPSQACRLTPYFASVSIRRRPAPKFPGAPRRNHAISVITQARSQRARLPARAAHRRRRISREADPHHRAIHGRLVERRARALRRAKNEPGLEPAGRRRQSARRGRRARHRDRRESESRRLHADDGGVVRVRHKPDPVSKYQLQRAAGFRADFQPRPHAANPRDESGRRVQNASKISSPPRRRNPARSITPRSATARPAISRWKYSASPPTSS